MGCVLPISVSGYGTFHIGYSYSYEVMGYEYFIYTYVNMLGSMSIFSCVHGMLGCHVLCDHGVYVMVNENLIYFYVLMLCEYIIYEYTHVLVLCYHVMYYGVYVKIY